MKEYGYTRDNRKGYYSYLEHLHIKQISKETQEKVIAPVSPFFRGLHLYSSITYSIFMEKDYLLLLWILILNLVAMRSVDFNDISILDISMLVSFVAWVLVVAFYLFKKK